MLSESQTHTQDSAAGGISIRAACDALASAVAAMTISNAARPYRSGLGTGTGPQRVARFTSGHSNLGMLKMRLAIFLYGHPVANIRQVLEAIENAQTLGEVQLLLDYILVCRGHAIEVRSDRPST